MVLSFGTVCLVHFLQLIKFESLCHYQTVHLESDWEYLTQMLLKRLFWCSHLPKRSAHPKGAVYLAGLSEQPNKCESVLKALAKWGHRSYCLIQRLLSACVCFPGRTCTLEVTTHRWMETRLMMEATVVEDTPSVMSWKRQGGELLSSSLFYYVSLRSAVLWIAAQKGTTIVKCQCLVRLRDLRNRKTPGWFLKPILKELKWFHLHNIDDVADTVQNITLVYQWNVTSDILI